MAALPPAARELVARHLAVLSSWNSHTNLTAEREPAELLERHVADSLALLPVIEGCWAQGRAAGAEGGAAGLPDPAPVPASLSPAPPSAPALRVLDVGSGAGFPGLSLAAARPHWRVTVMDSRAKRTAFLEEAAKAMRSGGGTGAEEGAEEGTEKEESTGEEKGTGKGESTVNEKGAGKEESTGEGERNEGGRSGLAVARPASGSPPCISLSSPPVLPVRVRVLTARAEEAGRDPFLSSSFDVVVARGVAALGPLAELSAPLLEVGGILVAPKGPDPGAEIAQAQRAMRVLGMEFLGVFSVESKGPNGLRTAVVLRKTQETPPEFPRENGDAQRHPL